MAAYVVVNTTNSGPNYTTSRDVTDGWAGRVVRPVLDKSGEWRPREEWLPAEQLMRA